MVTFKQITEQEIDVISKIGIETFKQTYSSILSAEQLVFMLDLVYSHENLKEQMSKKGYKFFTVHVDGGSECGFLAIEALGDNKFCLQRLYALNQYKGQGLGRKMLEFTENYALENGSDVNELILYVNKNNKTCDFYKYMGFEIIEDINFEIGNGFYRDDYIMSKSVCR